METRMEKFAQLREEIKKEIELDQEINEVNKVVNNYMNKLNVIDPGHFNSIKTDFEQEFSWEKVFLDKNPDEQPYSPNFKYDLQQLLNQIKTETKQEDLITYNSTAEAGNIMHNILISETLLNKPTYEKYQSILEDILNKKVDYVNQIEEIKKSLANYRINSSNIDFGTIAQIRKNDHRSTNEMLKEASSLVEEKHTNILALFRKTKLRDKYPLVVIIFVMIIMIVALVLMVTL
ncbi:hypothetical protein [Spiroplasma eriocheiris]|nr:hypothetical protein [Spiroplasma eriocheiris]AHF57489.1 hypothetical protein SPE_0360 [Spiroplasma eriocheiris CCTCC M 207170]